MNFLQSFPWLRWKVLDWGRNGWASCATVLARKASVNHELLGAEAISNQPRDHRYYKSRAEASLPLPSASLMWRNYAKFCWVLKLRAPGLPLADSLHTMRYDRQLFASPSFSCDCRFTGIAEDVFRCHPSYSERSSSRLTNAADGCWAQLICASRWPYQRTSRPSLELSSSGCPQPVHLIHSC